MSSSLHPGNTIGVALIGIVIAAVFYGVFQFTSRPLLSNNHPTTTDYSHGVLTSMCSPFFPQLREALGPFLVDKTKLIESIVDKGMCGTVDLVLRPRRCGKTTMLQMLRSFFGIPQNDDPDPNSLFRGLYIASKHDLCEKHMGKYPVIFCDFKEITGTCWDEMLLSFRHMISNICQDWHQYLGDSLHPQEKIFFESIRLNTAPADDWMDSLRELSSFLARKSGRRVIVLIDEYDAPFNRAYELGCYPEANEFFWRGVLPTLLKTNRHLEYAVLAGITPVAKAGWYSGLNNIDIHSLHRRNSIFAGMLMFTEPEVQHLRTLSNPEDLKSHYDSYLAAGSISVYNPVSIMSAFEQSMIGNFWVATGEFPLLHRNLPEDGFTLERIRQLLSFDEVPLDLMDNVTYSFSTLGSGGILTLLYYAGYLTMTPNDQYKIPNLEVMKDWARWLVGDIASWTNILEICMEGHVSTFEERWPDFMQEYLDRKMVTMERGTVSLKTPERIYHVYFLGILHLLRPEGWEISIEPRDRGDYVNIRLISRKTGNAVLIALKSSEKPEHMERDAISALEQIVDQNNRNQEGLPNIHVLREYSIASHHLVSCVKGRYLKLDAQSRWVEKDDPAMRT